MKKFLCVFLALFMLLLTGCSDGKEVYSGEGFKFGYAPDKWELNYVTDTGLAIFKSKVSDKVIFSAYRYTLEENVSLSERLESSKEVCEENGYIWDSGEILNIKGREWSREEYQAQIGDSKLKYVNLFADNGTYAYVISYASDIDSFDKCIKDFEEVFDSFRITE